MEQTYNIPNDEYPLRNVPPTMVDAINEVGAQVADVQKRANKEEMGNGTFVAILILSVLVIGLAGILIQNNLYANKLEKQVIAKEAVILEISQANAITENDNKWFMDQATEYRETISKQEATITRLQTERDNLLKKESEDQSPT